jgi:hypothetical protein
MPSDADRWRFLADHKLTLHTDGGDYLVHWCRTSGPGEPPRFYPVSNGRTPEEAVDRAIDRYRRKHGLGRESSETSAPTLVRQLVVRGWVS